MVNSVNKGNSLDLIATEKIVSGQVVISGKIAGVAISSAEIGQPMAVSTVGVYELPKKEGEEFQSGQRLYFSPIDSKLSNNKSPFFAGHCWESSGLSDTNGVVRLSYFGNNELENLINIESKSGFPEPDESNVIHLQGGKTYKLTTNVDLEGSRLVCDGVCGIFGENSETCTLKSTGLGAGFPLIQTAFSLPIQNLSITADWALDIDGLGNVAAIDWKALNFIDCPKVGTIKDVSNFIYQTSTLINSAGMELDGEIGTIAIETSLFQGNGTATDILKVADTCVILRRFRCIFSSFVSFGAQTSALNFSKLATVPTDSFILFQCNFSGGANYLSGVMSTDNKANFAGNKGIPNSGNIFSYYMVDNATVTPISTSGEFVKALGTTQAGEINQRFELSNNRATNTGDLTGFYKISGNISMICGNNKQLAVRLAFNGVTLESSQSRSTSNGNGRAENIGFFGVVKITGGQSDFIEAFVANNSDTSNITVLDLNLIGERLS